MLYIKTKGGQLVAERKIFLNSFYLTWQESHFGHAASLRINDVMYDVKSASFCCIVKLYKRKF